MWDINKSDDKERVNLVLVLPWLSCLILTTYTFESLSYSAMKKGERGVSMLTTLHVQGYAAYLNMWRCENFL